jgi:hypothetical protein
MPSIPQSLLWISLVVLWLFVLVPMLVNKRDTVRRTSDVALATRVVNNGVKSRLIRRSGPAAGHRHDPDWRPVEEFVEDYPDIDDNAVGEVEDFANQREMIREYDDAVREARVGTRSRSVMVVAAVREQSFVEHDYLDVDVVDENSGALPVGGAGVQGSLFDSLRPDQPSLEEDAVHGEVTEADEAGAYPHTAEDEADADAVAEAAEPVEAVGASPKPEIPVDDSEAERKSSAGEKNAGEYEYIDDTSGLETEAEFDDDRVAPRGSRSSSSRQRRLSTDTAAAVSARKYRFRKRVLMVMAALMMLSAVLSFTVSPALWWSCGAVATVTVLYLAYLRRQTRIEAQVRRRRSQRMARVRPVVDEQPAPRSPEVDFTEFPTRVQRLGAVVLDIDDEDPAFDHLDEVPYSRRYYGRPQAPSRDLPRASGQ